MKFGPEMVISIGDKGRISIMKHFFVKTGNLYLSRKGNLVKGKLYALSFERRDQADAVARAVLLAYKANHLPLSFRVSSENWS
jgi:hypothetical protein